MGDIVKHHVRQPGSEKVNYDDSICRLYSTAASTGAGTFYDSRVVQFHDPKEMDVMVGQLLGVPDSDISEWIYAHTQTFQHVYRIQHYVGGMFKDKNTISRYTKFFDTRHVLVHTLNTRSPVTSDYFDMVEDLFDTVERENP